MRAGGGRFVRTGAPLAVAAALAVLALIAACGDDESVIDGGKSPARLLIVAGDNQTATAGTRVPIPPSVRVVDADSVAIAGRPVSFEVASGGGSVTDDVRVSDQNGIATVGSWSLGEAAGANTLRTSVTLGPKESGVDPVIFSATGTEPIDRLAILTQPSETALNGPPLARQPVVQLQDSLGAPLVHDGVRVRVEIGGQLSGSIVGQDTVATADGIAAFTGIGILGGPGSYRLRFRAPGYQPVASAQIVLAPAITMTALPVLAGGTYKGFVGGLYQGGANAPPSAHAAEGAARAAATLPLDGDGNPSASGKIVLLSVGMSNASQEWCAASTPAPCEPWSFTGIAAADPTVNDETLVIANGAKFSETALLWDDPTDANYRRVRDTILAPAGLTERQVQVVWLKTANAEPTLALPDPNADAYRLLASIGDILRSLKLRYPNLQMVFLTSRIYAGFASIPLNPEPYAYEGGFAVKWAIEAQITQMASGGATIDEHAGDLSYDTVAPWIAWGPYIWADGGNANPDGLAWERLDFEADGIHPSREGEAKAAERILAFFKTSEFTRPWFLAGAD